MVGLVFLLQPAQDGNSILHARLSRVHLLEPALQRRILFDIFPIFVQRRGADAVQFAARQSRLEHVGSIHGPFGRAGTDQGVQFVDEEDDFTLRLHHFLDNRLQPVLEFAAVFGAGNERAHIQRDQALFLQAFRHVAGDDALGQSLDDCRFADPRFADKHGVVLGAPGQNLDDAANLVVPPDHGIKFPTACQVGKIAGILRQCLIFIFRVLIGHLLVAAYFPQCRENSFPGHTRVGQNPPRFRSPFAAEGKEEMFCGDESILEGVSLLLRRIQNPVQSL